MFHASEHLASGSKALPVVGIHIYHSADILLFLLFELELSTLVANPFHLPSLKR